jgi:hypothetical protein
MGVGQTRAISLKPRRLSGEKIVERFVWIKKSSRRGAQTNEQCPGHNQ